jgi:hypothetical protein
MNIHGDKVEGKILVDLAPGQYFPPQKFKFK